MANHLSHIRRWRKRILRNIHKIHPIIIARSFFQLIIISFVYILTFVGTCILATAGENNTYDLSMFSDRYDNTNTLVSHYLSLAFSKETNDLTEELQKWNNQTPPTIIPLPFDSIGPAFSNNLLVIEEINRVVRKFNEHSVIKVKSFSAADIKAEIEKLNEKNYEKSNPLIFVFLGNNDEVKKSIRAVIAEANVSDKTKLLDKYEFGNGGGYICDNVKISNSQSELDIEYYWFISELFSIDSCVYRLLFKTFGLVGIDGEVPSFLSRDSIFRGPTEFDWIALSVQNNPLIESGMSYDRAAQVAREVIENGRK